MVAYALFTNGYLLVVTMSAWWPAQIVNPSIATSKSKSNHIGVTCTLNYLPSLISSFELLRSKCLHSWIKDTTNNHCGSLSLAVLWNKPPVLYGSKRSVFFPLYTVKYSKQLATDKQAKWSNSNTPRFQKYIHLYLVN